jgi:hypothetical protein
MEGSPGRKPFFDMARGWSDATFLLLPPFSFPGVTARVFPLRASMNILSSFCRQYLNNRVPAEICELRPYLPYVLLVILDYGHMAIETANMGWVSQHEVFFAVPLERWRRHRGRMVFEGWVLNTPFIFVDNASSLTTGREVYGWPKVLASLQPSLEDWLVDPRDPTRLLSLSVKGFGSRDAEKVPLLEIEHGLDQNPSLVLTDLPAADPFKKLSRFVRNTWLAGVDLADLLLRSPLSGFGPQTGDLDSRAEVLFASLRQLFGFYGNPGVDVVTLKQFRDARSSYQSCYQALVKSRLSVDRFNRGGPLGLYNLLQGDVSGGYRIRLLDHPSYPIAALLGLQAVRERSAGGLTQSILEPFLPSWLSVDLTYSKGENLGWRMEGFTWQGTETEVTGPLTPTYNTVAGAAQQEWIGPFIVPKASCDVFPLPVYDRDRLSRFIHQYLNHGEPDRFEPWGGHIYMVASRSRIFSQARSAAVCEVAFFVPLLWRQEGRLKGIAVAKPFAFVDDPTFAMTLREVQGVPAMDATIETPVRSWLRRGPVLRMKTDVFTVLEAGLGSERRTVLEVVCGDPPPPAQTSTPSWDPSGRAAGEIRAEARKLFGGPVQLPVLTFKQFRDAEDPRYACYQALVLEPWTIFGKLPKRLGTETQVRVYKYPSLPMAKTLGLVDPTARPRKKGTEIVDVLKPEDPFRVDLDINMGLAEVLSHTAGNLSWFKPKGRETRAQKEFEEILEGTILCNGPQFVLKFLLDLASIADGDPGNGPGPAAERAQGESGGGQLF